MPSKGHSNSTAKNSAPTSDGSVSRRRLLGTAATTIVAGAGVSVASGSVAADTDGIAELDFRDGVPAVTDAPQDEAEIVFKIHGYTSSSASVERAATFRDTARAVGYDELVAAVTWDDGGLPTTAIQSARDTGDLFAAWLADYVDANPSTTIRILGHSMGGIVQMETLAAIDGEFTVATADGIGSYEASNAPCEDSDFFDAIQTSAEAVHNYYSTNDAVARLGSGPADCGGWFGDGTTPDNYADVDVSDSVSDHSAYREATGCVAAIVDNY
ncbi:alpha/beta hydrolase [Haloterrigena salifodinae]|uniref:alpha/beta hydrolase n=1 Tax=Haloterrigena salifodinae TaxID=2675099 RepID=UPI000F88EAED|nr:alpha/beta hydrolase [Haloterrigena salifodinae]